MISVVRRVGSQFLNIIKMRRVDAGKVNRGKFEPHLCCKNQNPFISGWRKEEKIRSVIG
jgi:hypothetical protein